MKDHPSGGRATRGTAYFRSREGWKRQTCRRPDAGSQAGQLSEKEVFMERRSLATVWAGRHNSISPNPLDHSSGQPNATITADGGVNGMDEHRDTDPRMAV